MLDSWRIGGGAPLLEKAEATGAGAVRPASEEDAGALARTMQLPTEAVLARFALGKHSYVATEEGQVAAYGWLSTSHEAIPELEEVFHPATGEGYVWDCFTLPDYRGRGLLPKILKQMATDLRQRAIWRVWAVILTRNEASRHAFAKAGYVKAADLTYLRLLCLRRLIFSADSSIPRGLISAGRKALG